MNMHVCIGRNLSTHFKEDPYKTESLTAFAQSLQSADYALIQFKDFCQKKRLIQPVAIPTGAVNNNVLLRASLASHLYCWLALC